MPSIHLIERLNNVRRLADGTWESGFWVVAEEKARELIGGDLHLHSGQKEPSHFGGRILGYRVHRDANDAQIDGRIVFRIEPTGAHKGVSATGLRWGNEKAFN
ncbi:MAG TPA: hypothetical protein VHA82_17540 [Ramlibacter sp.]|uniref:hypothetical protein n=1 Tax=Ramlibacter sp. TaxID=1917967 RepID=UPI002BAF006E|nr:hypothetical protein [Ramlibacter sp.]HVZ45618.1 hypothetical protein [Ramlibacter sp.]